MTVSSDRVRNVALVGHSGNGKTSLAEALLYRAGVISRPGRVEDGNTVCDTEPEEHDRQQSLTLTTASFDWDGYRINLIDTPGYVDFAADAIMALQVAELAVFVIDGVAGVQPQDAVMWRRATAMKLPRLVFINKLDRDNASFDRALAEVQTMFGSHTDPVELPIGAESSFHGIADLLTDRAFVYDSGSAVETDIPEDLIERERAEHEHLVEDVVEIDDEMLEKYLEVGELTPEELEKVLHEAVDQATVFPVLCGSATTPIGTDKLAEFICHVGPAPGDLGPIEVTAGDGAIPISPDPEGEKLAFVFKTKIDDYLGQLSLFKVLSGTIKVDDVLVNPRTNTKERLHQLFRLSGSSHEAVTQVTAGDIAAVAKLNDTRTGDSLAPDGTPVYLEPPELPAPVYGIAVMAASRANEDRLAHVLQRVLIEDPSLSVRHDDSTGQTVLSGSGEAHLQIALARVARLGVEVETAPVRVSFRETLAGPADVEGKYKKQTGGHGQFGVAWVRFEPLNRGAGFEFIDEVKGGAIPKSLIPAVAAGIEEAMVRGGGHGYPVVDLRATVYDGKHHSVDSSEMSFKMAGSLAFRAAIEKVGVNVLEPVSEIAVHVPSIYQGEVLGDLNSRRAQVLGTEPGDTNDMTTIRATVPTMEILRYAVDLRSMTAGTGTYEAEHYDYQPLPGHLLASIAANEDA